MRVVVEHQNPLVAAEMAGALEAAGHSVVTCRGPTLSGGRECPVLEDRTCPLVEGADVVLAALPSDQLEVYVALRAQYAVPVVLSLPDAERARLPILEQIGPWIPELQGPRLARALEVAMGTR